MQTRREFLGSSAALALMPAIPAIGSSAPAKSVPLSWFYAGSDEFVYPYLAENVEDAIGQYAADHDATFAEHDCPGLCHDGTSVTAPCPHCGGDPDAPAGFVEAHQPEAWVNLEGEPTSADWVRAGIYTFCDVCDFEECIECVVHEGKAVCLECYHDMVPDGDDAKE